MVRHQSEKTSSDDVDKFRDAMERRLRYKLEKDETPVAGLNPYHRYYKESGVEFFRMILEHLNITKSNKVLEIGCGTGRIAVPFINHIGNNYYGFDVNDLYVDYCRTISGNFTHLDVIHEDWNPAGSINPTEVAFPHKNNYFSAVFSIAVFNHFHISWFKRYVAESARVLTKGGKIFFTLIITSEPKSDTGPPFKFNHRTEEEWYDYEDKKLYNVAFPEKLIRRIMIENGLMIQEPIRYGSWNKSPLALSGHDVIIAHKRR